MATLHLKLLHVGRLSNRLILSSNSVLQLSKDQNNLNGLSIGNRYFSRTTVLPSADSVLVSVENGVRNVVFNRPKAKNAMTYEVMDKIGNALFESNSDTATKIVTITGAGDFFSSGNDFSNWHTANQTTTEIKEKTRKYVYRQLMLGFIECRKPIIAMVNGPAIGAGATLLPFCDQVLASDKAFFLTPFPSIGIVPEFCSSYTFPKIMGYAKANDMLLFSHKMTAKEALDCGLVSKLFPSESFADSCQKLVDIYSKFPIEPLLKAKELIRAPEREKLLHLCAYEMDYVVDAIDSPLVRSHIDKFFSNKNK